MEKPKFKNFLKKDVNELNSGELRIEEGKLMQKVENAENDLNELKAKLDEIRKLINKKQQ